MKNENNYFKQIDKDRIVRVQSISYVKWDKDDKCYRILIDGSWQVFDKEDGKKILDALGIKP